MIEAIVSHNANRDLDSMIFLNLLIIKSYRSM